MSEALIDYEKQLQQTQELIQAGDLFGAQALSEVFDLNVLNDAKNLQFAAIAFRQLNLLGKACEFSSKAWGLEPDAPNLALAHSIDLLKLGKLDEADAVLDSLANKPRFEPLTKLNRSKILYQRKDFKAASKLLVSVVQQNPGFAAAHMEMAETLLMQGKWPAGWQAYESRYKLAQTENMLPKFKIPHWDGSINLPHILLIADQGYGDCFQFSRYIPLVAEQCQQVTLLRSEPLARLLDANPCITSSFGKWQDAPAASAYCTLSGLPRLFSTLPDTIPDCSGVLRAHEQDVVQWKKRLKDSGNHTANKPKLRIGIAWSGRMEFENNFLRAMPFEKFKPLLEIPEFEFFSLQVGAPSRQAQTEFDEGKMTDLAPELSDFAETAAAMEALDLIITTDTSIAHLAGALGRPSWVLLGYAPDWRWGSKGTSSPWYPNTRVIRQQQRGDWQDVVEECQSMLQKLSTEAKTRKALVSLMQQEKQNPWV